MSKRYSVLPIKLRPDIDTKYMGALGIGARLDHS